MNILNISAAILGIAATLGAPTSASAQSHGTVRPIPSRPAGPMPGVERRPSLRRRSLVTSWSRSCAPTPTDPV